MIERRTFLGALAALPLVGAGPAAAGRAPVFSEHGIAIRGADPVAYFKSWGAVAGSVDERVMWRGALWLFANPENREAFERNPKRYAPRFGGYCAYTLSQGALSAIDPRAFAIHDGRLYLVRSLETREVWMENLARNIKQAEARWPSVLG